MAEVNPNPISRGALRIGSALALSARRFKQGVTSTIGLGRDVIGRTKAKIKSTDKKIDIENKKQRTTKRKTKETVERKERENFVEAGKIVTPAKRLVNNLIKKPMQSLMDLFLAWAVMNLPAILKVVTVFIKRVRVLAAALKRAFVEGGKIFQSIFNVGKAYIENILNFDFADESGKVEAATQELDDNIEAVNTNLAEIKNVWSREEEELDKILKQLEEGAVITDALNTIPMPRDINTSEYVDPTETITGDPAPSTSGGGMSRLQPIHKRALDKIAQYESKSAGGYNAMNQGTVPDKKGQPPKSGPSKNIIGKNLTDMTVGEIIAAQNKRLTNDQGFIHAAGRYQFIGNTLPSVVQSAGIPMNTKFTPEVQDQLAVTLMQQRGAEPWLADKRTPLLRDQAGIDLINQAGKTPMLATPQPTGNDRGPAVQPAQQTSGATKAADGKPLREGTAGLVEQVNSVGGSILQMLGLGGNQQQNNESSSSSSPVQPATGNTGTSGVGSASDSQGRVLGGTLLYSKDFDTKDYSAPSQIIRTSDRGWRWGRMHQGVDFGTGGQRDWYCALLLDGKVSYVGYDAGGGNMAFIESGGIEYVFMHLAKYASGISQGATYKAGQPIGEVGNTGRGTGIHLHFEVRRNNTPFNPDPYVKYVVFGKLVKKARSATIASNASANSQELATTAASRRTTTGQTTSSSSVTLVKQTEVYKVA